MASQGTIYLPSLSSVTPAAAGRVSPSAYPQPGNRAQTLPQGPVRPATVVADDVTPAFIIDVW